MAIYIVCTNPELFQGECDQAGSREFLFGLLDDSGTIAGQSVLWEPERFDGIPAISLEGKAAAEAVHSELKTTGSWEGYDQRPLYEIRGA